MKQRTYITHIDIEQIVEKICPQYIILFGGRNDGKSYAVKEKVLRDYIKSGKQFTYVRRNDVDLRNNASILYFADFLAPGDDGKNKIQHLTGDEYNNICEYRKGLYFSNVDDEGKETRGPQIGYVHALSLANKRYKSMQFPEVYNIIFEEFCTNEGYLQNEVSTFMNYCSTVLRSRAGLVMLVGNTVSRNNVYFREWEMFNILKQQPGTVDVYNYHEEDKIIKIALYYTKVTKPNSMFFGTTAKMINKGEFDVNRQPHLEKPVSEYDSLYKLVFTIDKNNTFMMQFLVNGETCVWYVTPKTTPIKKDTRIVSPDLFETPYYTKNFIPINEAEKSIFEYLKRGLIAYSDNLTGTEFKRCIKELHNLT